VSSALALALALADYMVSCHTLLLLFSVIYTPLAAL